jgi:hypothetical protein
MTDQSAAVDTLGIDQLTAARTAAKTLWQSGLLQPHEKTHLWEIILRIDGLLKVANEQDGERG